MVNKFKHKLKRRENGISRIPITPEQMKRGYCLGSELRHILQQEYPELYCHFKQYRGLDIIDSNKYGFLKEVLYDDVVVGFAIYDKKGAVKHQDFPNLITLVLIYILPEYRGKRLMYSEIKDTMSLHPNCIFSIDLPNFHIIKSLINNGYATKLNEHIVYLGDTPITAQVNGDTYFYPLYDLRIKAGINLELPSLTSMVDRDIIDGFLNPVATLSFLDEYNSLLEYFEEIANDVRVFNEKEFGDNNENQ